MIKYQFLSITLDQAHECFPYQLLTTKFKDSHIQATGNLQLIANKSKKILILGCKNPTPKAIAIAKLFALNLCRAGIIPISGMEPGLSAYVHVHCMKHGYGLILPQLELQELQGSVNNFKLLQLIKYKGLVLTLKNVNSKNKTIWSNYIASLSDGVLLIENDSLEFCINMTNLVANMNKEMFVVPWSIDHPFSHINSILIQNGAKLVYSHNDVINEFFDLSV